MSENQKDKVDLEDLFNDNPFENFAGKNFNFKKFFRKFRSVLSAVIIGFNSFVLMYKNKFRGPSRKCINETFKQLGEMVDNASSLLQMITEDTVASEQLVGLFIKVQMATNKLTQGLSLNHSLGLSANLLCYAEEFADSLKVERQGIQITDEEEYAEASRMEKAGLVEPGFAEFVRSAQAKKAQENTTFEEMSQKDRENRSQYASTKWEEFKAQYGTRPNFEEMFTEKCKEAFIANWQENPVCAELELRRKIMDQISIEEAYQEALKAI
jgi:hypothetical protein